VIKNNEMTMENSRREFLKKSALGVAGFSFKEYNIDSVTPFDSPLSGKSENASTEWVSATDEIRVIREGLWQEASFRYAERKHLRSATDGTSLKFGFSGTMVTIRLGQHAVPAYNRPNTGALKVKVDNGRESTIYPLNEPREIVLARNLPFAEHTVQIRHEATKNDSIVCIEAFGYSSEPTGELSFNLTGKHNAWLVDARAILYHHEIVIANRLVRNWLTGQCRLTGLPPGKEFRLELHAIGWNSFIANNIEIQAGKETILPPVYLDAAPPEAAKGWLFPHIGRQTIRKAGESFRTRFQAPGHIIHGMQIESHMGPATISRKLAYNEDEGAAYLYDREFVVAIPVDTPPGLYDLKVRATRPEQEEVYDLCSYSSVMVVKDYPVDPVFMSWGHLDTQGQYQAEYLRDMAEIANLAGADMVLMACACNPAYIAGALSVLEIPYTVNFGNHQFPGFEQWYGPQENIVDFGPDMCILNRSLPWHESTVLTDALFSERPDARIKIINAFEHNAPFELLDNHKIALLHDGHGIEDRVMKMGKTPTQRVGKINAQSFRIIRFKNEKVVSCTYMNDAVAPIPFARGSVKPLRVSVDPPANGHNKKITITVINDLLEAFPGCRIAALMPAGKYICKGGVIELAVESDCKRFLRLVIRTDMPPETQMLLSLYQTAVD
jgi:hypothetical protein